MGETSSYKIPRLRFKFHWDFISSMASHFHFLFSGQQLRLWYDDDFLNKTEDDNVGESCTDVFAKYL